ncbi:MAG: hypothetical protein GY757_43195 [bacterium]|nr:hypothetical protein [bacterium]
MKDFVCISELKKRDKLVEEMTRNGLNQVKGGYFREEPIYQEYGVIDDPDLPGNN